MSRRKQSNPKPIKHGEEGDDHSIRNVATDPSETSVENHDTVEDNMAGADDAVMSRDTENEERSQSVQNGSPDFPRDENRPVTTDSSNSAMHSPVRVKVEPDDSRDEEMAPEKEPLGEDAHPIDDIPRESPRRREHASENLSVFPERQSSASNINRLDSESIVVKTEPVSSPQEHSSSHSPQSQDFETSPVKLPNTPSSSSSIFRTKRIDRTRSRSRSKSGGVAGSSSDSQSSNGVSRAKAEEELVNRLQLPSDVLYLRQEEMRVHGTASIGWVVCCAIPLPQGSSLGPFQGELVPPEAVKVGDLIVQFTSKKGQQALLNVAGQSGGWLALLRSATSPSELNTHVYWEGGGIWCEIISDIEIGTELRAAFTFHLEEEGVEDGEDERESVSQDGAREYRESGGGDEEEASTSGSSDSHHPHLHPQKQPELHPHQQQPAPGHAALIYGCPFCGVRFSSPRTLQGHLSFYCSKKTSDATMVAPTVVKGSNSGNSSGEDARVKVETDDVNDKNRDVLNRTDDMQSQPEVPESSSRHHPSLSSPPIQVFRCKFCSYKADKLSSLNRHMRMHNSERARAVSARDEMENAHGHEALKSPMEETFCKECKIQFSSLHTYKCHKEHYCAQRRKRMNEVSLTDTSAFAAMFQPPLSFQDAGNIGIPSALQMAALNQGGLILPGAQSMLQASVAANASGAATVILTAPVLTANGVTPMAITMPTVIMSPVMSCPPRGQDSPRVKLSPRSPARRESGARSPAQYSDHSTPAPREAHLASSSSSRGSPTQTDYTATLARLRDGEGFSRVKPETSTEEEHPLDLSVAKKEKDDSMDKEESISLPPRSRNPLVHSGAVAIPSTSSISSIDHTSPSVIRENFVYQTPSGNMRRTSTSPALSLRNGAPPDVKEEPRDHESPATASQLSTSRSDSLSPTRAGSAAHSAMLPHPSLLITPPAFLSMTGVASLPMSPTNRLKVQMAALSNPNTPNVGISKCSDCNIVFYKHENYLIHKKHYCSGKRRLSLPMTQTETPKQEVAETADMPEEPRARPEVSPPIRKVEPEVADQPSSPSVSEPSTSTTAAPPSDVMYKYFCVPCRIKFSNASILEAHKEYYCPAGKDSEQSIIVQSSSQSDAVSTASLSDDTPNASPESAQEEFTCTQCSSVFTSARLLRLHMCDGGYPCPHCDHVAITENRLSEHMKAHAPTRAYRCTICGYRGNTARGMRMHGKTHIDEGIHFTDEHMLEYHEPALMPILPSNGSGAGTDSELLRMKNEPYKRRRSRKAYEKFDFPLPKVDVPQTCPLCGQRFANADFLSSHFKVHEIQASQYMAGLLKCIQCNYVGKNVEDLRAHFQLTHIRDHRRGHSPSGSASEDEENVPGPSRTGSDGAFIKSEPDRSEEESLEASQTSDTFMVLRDPNSPIDEKPETNQEDIKQSCTNSPRSVSPRPSTSRDSPPSEPIRVKTEPVDEDYGRERQTEHTDWRNNNFLYERKRTSDDESSDRNATRDSHSPQNTNNTSSNSPESHPTVDTERSESRFSETKTRSEPSVSSPSDNVAESRKRKLENSEESPMPPKKRTVSYHSDQMAHERHTSVTSNGVTEEDSFLSHSENIVVKTERESPAPEPSSHFMEARSSDHERSPPQEELHRKAQTITSIVKQRISPPTSSPLSPSSIANNLPLYHAVSPALLGNPAFPYTHAPPFPYLFFPPHRAGATPSPRPIAVKEENGGSRYCQNCDISFSKHATYLAHKKYYCTARSRGDAASTAKA